MTADGFRAIVLAFAGVEERSHMAHPDFRVGGRVFASLDQAERWGTVKLSPAEQQEFMALHPDVFVPAAGSWGQQGWTKIDLKCATVASVRPAALLAWEGMRQRVAEKPRTRVKRKT